MFLDYYAILESEENATFDEIKVAYKKQVVKWHPDKNPISDTTKQMQLINEAYLILKDPEARVKYDIEYKKFKHYKAQTERYEQEHYQNQENNRYHKTYEYTNYEFDDDILKKWMQNAKKQAQEMVDELKGASKEGAKSITRYLWYFLPFLIGYFLIRGCHA